MVPHGNKTDLKDILRSDSSTAHFPKIRTVESPETSVWFNRLWETAADRCSNWMISSYNLEEIAGFAQLFVLKTTQKVPILFVAKVVDDFRLADASPEMHRFHDVWSAKYKVGRFNPILLLFSTVFILK